MSPLAGAAAPALATWHDLRRRPALLLSCLAVAVFQWLLPDICARAVDDSSALGLQAAVSTIGLYLIVVGGLAGLRAGAPEGDLGAAAEWRTSPLSNGAYVAGRFLGIVAVAGALLAVLVPLLVAGQIELLAEQPPDPLVVLLTLAGSLLGAAQFAALGLLLAALTSPQLATIGLIALLAATRTVVPELARGADLISDLAAVIPDTASLDLSRELAFHRAVDAPATFWALSSTALSTAACLFGAAWAVGRRET